MSTVWDPTAYKWFEHSSPDSCLSDTGVEMLWNVFMETNTKVRHNRPDIVVKMPNKWFIIDKAVPQDHLVTEKENEKISKYLDLAGVIRAEHHVSTEIIPLIIGTLGTIPKRLTEFIKELDHPNFTGSAQITAIASTTRILRDVLGL